MQKINTYEFTYTDEDKCKDSIRIASNSEEQAIKLFREWQEKYKRKIASYTVRTVYDNEDAEEYGIRYAQNPERAKLLHCILLNIGENFYRSGEGEDGEAFALTESEVAADALLETLYNLGFEEEGNPDTTEPDYRREEVFVNGFLCYKFTEF